MNKNQFDFKNWIKLELPVPKNNSIDRLIDDKENKTVKLTIPTDSVIDILSH